MPFRLVVDALRYEILLSPDGLSMSTLAYLIQAPAVLKREVRRESLPDVLVDGIVACGKLLISFQLPEYFRHGCCIQGLHIN